MNTRAYAAGGAAVAVVAAVIVFLQGFDAEKISCDAIGAARAELQSAYDAGVAASVEVYAQEREGAEAQVSECLRAEPVDPCAGAQAARDAAVAEYQNIPSPADSAPYAEFQTYFEKRENAYANYKKAKEELDQCRTANPPKTDIPYEQSDTKMCFDRYDASTAAARSTFEKNTQTMRATLNAGLAALDAREKACNPPKGREKFTDPIVDGTGTGDGVPVHLMSCRLISTDTDAELLRLRARAAALPGEIQAVETSIENARKRMRSAQRDLLEVGTYIPPESTRTQFEGTINALRAQRKISLELTLEFYKDLIARKQAEKEALEQELRDTEAQIRARLEQIRKENEARERNFPTALRFAKPDKCAYYHCHGLLCGKNDPAPDGCGQGATTPDDTECKQFFDSYLDEAGVY